jgi:BlaI family transcriptional regulator, penicillinase repressor
MKELTKAEEQVMQYIWRLEKSCLKHVVEQYPEPKPAYTTISTVVRVLVKKGFIAYKTQGKVHEYYPLVAKDDYFKKHFNGIIRKFFNDSVSNFVSVFNKDDLSITELEKIKKSVEQIITEKKR